MVKIKILVAFTTNDVNNPFVKELIEGLKHSECVVSWSLEDFWNKKGNYDIIHIQWPEYLFSKRFTDGDLDLLHDTLEYWKRKSAIILTRHNKQPHNVKGGGLYCRLYDLIYSFCDGIAHLGPYDLDEFTSRYSCDCYGNTIMHRVIPHHIYINSYVRGVDQKTARHLLDIDVEKFVILVFGRIRHDEEKRLLKSLFKQYRRDDILFLVPSWLPFDKGVGLKGMFRNIFDKIQLALINLNKNVIVSDKFIADEWVPFFFNASDAILIPRTDCLNSGNITLGFYFKKIVIGPMVGNIEFELRESGNVLFAPASKPSLKNAITEAKKSAFENRGLDNYKYAMENRHPDIIAGWYRILYEDCIRKRRFVEG